MNEQTMRQGLKECWNAPLVPTSSSESLNDTNLQKQEETLSDSSKPLFPVGSGYNSHKRASLSGKHNVFVLGIDGKPLTPTTNTKARKLMKEKQAKPVWNKFGKFGIQMLVETRKETPKTVLGVDNGTKFEGYTITTDNENNFAVMWNLPDKKKLVKKLEERKRLRRARRFRNCRRRKCRFQNRKETFIAPSQKQIIDSRLKCIVELAKCYPVNTVAIEDVRFNHKRYRYGKNFSTIEIGKTMINDFFIEQDYEIFKYQGHETEELRKKLGYHKLKSDKSKKDFRTHCSDALAISVESLNQKHIEPTYNFVYVDDSYRPTRRRLHDTQPAKGGIRAKYSSGNFKSIKKGTICDYGQIVGGTKNMIWYQDWSSKPQKGKVLNKTSWYSKQFKTMEGVIHPYTNSSS